MTDRVVHARPSDDAAAPHDDFGAVSRAGLLKMIAAGGAGAAGLSLITSSASASTPRASTKMDLTILEYALTLEYLGAAFYESALQHAHLRGDAYELALAFRGHERAHVAFVRKTITALGGKPHPPQTFDFGSATRSRTAFLRSSEKIENMCVETLNGAAPLVSKPVLKGASELVSVEARQASWVRAILHQNAAPVAFTQPLTAHQSQAAVRKLGFVKGALS